jgi:hypothetical protein
VNENVRVIRAIQFLRFACFTVSTLQPLGRDLLEGKMRDVGPLCGVFDGDAQDAAVFVHVQERVPVQVTCFGDIVGFELDVKRVGLLKVSYFYIVNASKVVERTREMQFAVAG